MFDIPSMHTASRRKRIPRPASFCQMSACQRFIQLTGRFDVIWSTDMLRYIAFIWLNYKKHDKTNIAQALN